MTAKIIAVANQKGGSGKTTISMHLAGAFCRRGNKVLVVDADVQATATRWAASANDEEPFPASVTGLSAAEGKVHREVKKFVNDYDWIIIDCPPAADSPVPKSALLIADLGIIPVIPSPPDLWAAIGIREVIEHCLVFNEQLQTRIVVNQLQSNTNVAREVSELLPEYNIPVFETRIGMRTVYRQAAGIGSTVHALGYDAKTAILEIETLTDEVCALFEGGPQ
ncbi:MAG: AAA family ATPase [Blastocatellia bacterium]|nr:AAA family ATPase [Blastocatellia bacterium]